MLSLILAVALGGDVVVFGDSWGEGGGTPLQQELNAASLGLSISNHAVGGTTAAYWNSQPGAFAAAVTANPGARWVWLSILGNDTFAHHAASEGQHAAARNDANLRTLLDDLFAVHPDVEVVLFAYDYVNFERSAECIATAAVYFPQLVQSNTFSTPSINQIFVRDVYDVQANVAADYPQVTVYNIFGTLQADAGTVGAPNPLLPSPASRMSDCIHPTQAGYRAIHRELVRRYWQAPAPTASLSGPTHACLGDEVTFSSTSAQAASTSWYLHDEYLHDGPSLIFDADEPSVEVRMEVRNGAWKDAVTTTVTTSTRPTPPDLAEIVTCPGEPRVLDAGFAPASWAPVADLSDPTSSTPTVYPTRSTTYSATLGEPGCSSQATQQVRVLPAPNTGVAGEVEVEVGVSYTYRATGDGVDPVWEAPNADLSAAADPRDVVVVWRNPGAASLGVHTTHPTSGCQTEAELHVEVFPAGQLPSAGGSRDGSLDTGDRTAQRDGCACRAGGGSSSAILGLFGLAIGAARRKRPCSEAQSPASTFRSRW